MGLLAIVRRSLRQHAVSTAITALSVALACGLVMSVFSIAQQTREAFTGGDVGFDAVVGARGSKVQLVLNTVFHLETSPGNLPYSVYTSLKKDRRVDLAVPYALGDNYLGYRIIGTTTELFTDFEYRKGHKLTPRAPGRFFDPKLREAVVGATVARRTGLVEGKTFMPYHGLDYAPSAHQHPIEYLVVGVLEPTNSPTDRAIFIPIEGVWRMEGHSLVGKDGEEYVPQSGVEIPDEYKEVSAVMLRLRGVASGFQMSNELNRRTRTITMAWPIADAMAELFDKIGWVVRVLELVAYIVVVVAAASILASLYNTMNERRREFAILRALGARRSTVFAVIVLEAGAIALLGSLGAFAVYGAIVSGAQYIILRETGVIIDVYAQHHVFWAAPLGMTVLGALSGLAPAIKAYRTDVAANLLPTS